MSPKAPMSKADLEHEAQLERQKNALAPGGAFMTDKELEKRDESQKKKRDAERTAQEEKEKERKGKAAREAPPKGTATAAAQAILGTPLGAPSASNVDMVFDEADMEMSEAGNHSDGDADVEKEVEAMEAELAAGEAELAEEVAREKGGMQEEGKKEAEWKQGKKKAAYPSGDSSQEQKSWLWFQGEAGGNLIDTDTILTLRGHCDQLGLKFQFSTMVTQKPNRNSIAILFETKTAEKIRDNFPKMRILNGSGDVTAITTLSVGKTDSGAKTSLSELKLSTHLIVSPPPSFIASGKKLGFQELKHAFGRKGLDVVKTSYSTNTQAGATDQSSAQVYVIPFDDPGEPRKFPWLTVCHVQVPIEPKKTAEEYRFVDTLGCSVHTDVTTAGKLGVCPRCLKLPALKCDCKEKKARKNREKLINPTEAGTSRVQGARQDNILCPEWALGTCRFGLGCQFTHKYDKAGKCSNGGKCKLRACPYPH